ncbi:MAG: ACT domain-containing protein [Erysipelotrichales bacterium]|nr:ACT domain-containing protein [Erysipelotrichales bacterium]
MKLIPKLSEGRFEFITTQNKIIPANAKAMIVEDEGVTFVLPTDKTNDDIFAWISLVQETSLTATGITKVISAALSDAGIACNILAAYYHDHILVPHDKRKDAMQIIAAIEI